LCGKNIAANKVFVGNPIPITVANSTGPKN
jgi:hypothetical protein